MALAAEGHDDIKLINELTELYDDLVPVWQVFNRLSGSRESGFGVNAIKPSEIRSRMDEMEIFDPDDREEFDYLINALDHEFMDHHSKKQETKTKANKKR